MKIEKSAHLTFEKIGKNPNHYCMNYLEAPAASMRVHSNEVGYVQSIYFERLDRFASEINSEIYVKFHPGSFVGKNTKIVDIKIDTGEVNDKKASKEVNECFVVDDTRSLEHDARYNLLILSEVSSRAMSPGVNDPGTAIDALRSAMKVFHKWLSLRIMRFGIIISKYLKCM